MTRVNCNINVKNLTDEHLLAEHREIKRIPTHFNNHGIKKVIPEFTLGKGHVLFFLDKPLYTLVRYNQIYKECIKRGLDIQNYSENWACYPPHMFMHGPFDKLYTPGDRERSLLVERISSRIIASYNKGNIHHYYRKALTQEQALQLLIK